MLARIASALNTSADYLLGLTDDPAPADKRTPRIVLDDDRFLPVPRLTTVAAAGSPAVTDEEIADWYPFRKDWLYQVADGPKRQGRLVLIKVAPGWLGESMLPTIRPNALLLVDREPPEIQKGELKFGKVYVLYDDSTAEGITVKRVYQQGRTIICAPDNPGPGREPFTIRLRKGEPLATHIRGRVLWVANELEE